MDFITRIEEEEKSLEDKMDKLVIFLGTTTFGALSEIHQRLLIAQFNAMESYRNILQTRLLLLKSK